MSLLNRMQQYPINDVSTDVEAPPPLDGRDDTPGGGPAMTEERRAKSRQAYPELLGGLVLPLAPKQALALAEQQARRQPGWSIRRMDAAQGLLTALAITPFLRFRGDVTIRVRSAANGSRVDVRSRSRLGRDDLGANASRIRRFLRGLQAEQAG